MLTIFSCFSPSVYLLCLLKILLSKDLGSMLQPKKCLVLTCNYDMNFCSFFFQKKAEEAHKILEGLGPKVELVCDLMINNIFALA